MGFPRQFRGYISNPYALAQARIFPLQWSYVFQLHVFVAFVISVAFMPELVGLVQEVGARVAKIPAGIVFEKKGATLFVTGVALPFTATTTQGVIVVSKDSMKVFADGVAAPKNILLWADTRDVRVTSDDVKSIFTDHMDAAIIVVVLLTFLYFFLTNIIFSGMLILVWTMLGAAVRIGLGKRNAAVPVSGGGVGGGVTMRDSIAVGLVALTGPLVLWTMCTLLGLQIAGLVEIIAFIVYSTVGLRTPILDLKSGAGEKKV